METSHDNYKSNPPALNALKLLLREIGVYMLIGFVAALALLFLFAKLAEDVFANEVSGFDNNLELSVHSWSNPVFDSIFNFFTLIGGFSGIGVLAAITFVLLLWQHKFYWAWLVVIGVAVGIGIDELLKAIFRRPRPELWIIHHQPASFSFPSGHATASFCYFGILLWLGLSTFKRPLLKAGWALLMILFVFLIGLSRIYLGAHYPTDVLGAWLASGVWLLILLNGAYFFRRLRNLPPPITTTADAS